MRAFVEFIAKGGRRLFIDSAAILGVETFPERASDWVSGPDDPIRLLIRNAEPVEIVGTSAILVFAQMSMVAEKVQKLKDDGRGEPIALQFLEEPDAD